MSKHIRVDGKLLQVNKRYSNLNQKQQAKIAGWMYEAFKKQMNERLSDDEALNYVYDKIDGGKMSSIKYHLGDITKLKVDAIVNAANSSLLGGGGVDGAIHRAAGPQLLEECRTLNGCRTGEAKITGGYNLPAKHVIHTVGPIYSGSISDAENLRNCYWNSLEVAKTNDLHSIAFPGISTGVYGYPKKEAAKIALKTVKEWLESNSAYEIEITIVNFSEEDYLIYQTVAAEMG